MVFLIFLQLYALHSVLTTMVFALPTPNKGRTPPHDAASRGRDMIVKCLPDSEANTVAKDNSRIYQMTSQLWADENTQQNEAIQLSNPGADSSSKCHCCDSDSKCHVGYTRLNCAVINEDPEMIKLLLGNEANIINVTDNEGRTALHHAAERGSNEIVTLLLDSGANIDAKDNYGMAPLSLAVESNQLNATNLLLDRKADPDSKNVQGDTPLHYAVVKKYLEMVKLLLRYGPNINIKDNKGRTPLHEATLNTEDEIMTLLLDHKANIEAKDNSQTTPLILAVENNQVNAAKLLLSRGASITSTTKQKYTPLHIAVHKRNRKMTLLLQGFRANIHFKDSKGKSPFQIAKEKESNEIVRDMEYIMKHPLTQYYNESQGEYYLNDIDDQGRYATITWAPKCSSGFITFFHKDKSTFYKIEVTLKPTGNEFFSSIEQNNVVSSHSSKIRHCNIPSEAPSKNPSDVDVWHPLEQYIAIALKKCLEDAVKATENHLKNSTVWKKLLEKKCVSTSNQIQGDLYNAIIKYADYFHTETKNITDENIDDEQARSQLQSATTAVKVCDASTSNSDKKALLQDEMCTYLNESSTSWKSQDSSYTNISEILMWDTESYQEHWHGLIQRITFTGLCVSIFSLSICILSFAWFSKTKQGKRREHNFSRMNLCICLLLVKSLLLKGIMDEMVNEVLFAVSLQYLLLATFTWSAIEAFHLYKNFIVIFKTDGSRKKTFLAVGYLGPMLVLAPMLILSNHDNNGTRKICWLQKEMNLIFAGMIIPILLVNMSLFVLVMRIAWGKENLKSKSIISKLGGSFTLFFFLCLTWIPWYFYLTKGSGPVLVLFAVLNSFEGIPIFITSILLDKSIMGWGKITKN